MNDSKLVLVSLVVLVLVAFALTALPWLLLSSGGKCKGKEGFATGIPGADALDRDEYIDQSRKKYNKFSDSMDVQRGNFLRTDDQARLDGATRDIRDAMRTSDLERSDRAPTFLDIIPNAVTAQMPPPNNVYTEAKKCESLRTRGSCAKLSDPAYSNCGICIKAGSPYTFENPKKHIGGLLVLPDDRSDAEEAARASGSKVTYQATVGDCPAGFLHVSQKTCEKEVNRQDCLEAGTTGGFDVGVTVEGNKVANAKCALVAGTDDTFVYEPKTRTFDVNLRVLTPTGTGTCKVYVYNAAQKQVGYNTNDTPGKEFIVSVRQVKEGEPLSIVVVLEVPYRAKGSAEVFQFSRGGPKQTVSAICQQIGATAATLGQMNAAQQAGAQMCGNGWGADFYGYPSQASVPGACGSYFDPNANPAQQGASWCYGVKPPESKNKMINSSVAPWFNTYGAKSVPPHDVMPNQWSQNGDYQAQAYRGILLQWEMTGSSARTIPFQPTLTAVNGEGPNNAGTFRHLKLYGTFAKSSTILAPRPSGNSKMLSNQFWIWGGDSKSQQVKFDVKVPGVFLDPYYKEDLAVAPRGSLIGSPATLQLLKTSPCLQEGQAAGAYSMACLTNLFVGAGGDPIRGTLATGGLTQLNKLGDMDAIAGYLSGLFSVATTGKNEDGRRVGNSSKDRLQIINDAAQKMFGFDIATPCEDIVEDAKGNIGIVPKSPPLDGDCLNYLWLNTNSDRDRGDEGGRNSAITNTYTTIADRYSGLRYSEGTADSRSRYPFQACQRVGTKAPMAADGTVNVKNVMEANAKGSIQKIQDFYNGIHKTANYSGGSASAAEAHTTAVQQCYGLAKTAAPVKECPKPPVASSSHLGCFNDCQGGRAIPNIRSWNMQSGNNLKECEGLAKAAGDNIFGLQYYRECWSGKDVAYDRMGAASNCPPNGGSCTQQVYKIN